MLKFVISNLNLQFTVFFTFGDAFANGMITFHNK